MIAPSNNLQQRSSMIDNTYRVVFQSRYGRKILQDNSSSSSFNASQPSFIALLCVIAVLTIAIVVTTIVLCYRCYSHREQKGKRRNKFGRVLSVPENQQLTVPISITPSSASFRSSRHLFPNQQPQTPSISTSSSSSGHLQPSMIGAYLNDLNTFQPATLDAKQLNDYLFIDLHSTSSETFPDVISKQLTNDRNTNNTNTSGYYTSTGGEDQLKHRHHNFYYSQQPRRRSASTLKRSNVSRFVMRERSLPNNRQKLPQLRQTVTHQQRHLFGTGDMNNSSTSTDNQDQLSTNISITTDDYNDSHAYHVNQSQTLQTIKEESSPMVHQILSPYDIHHEEEPYCFEMVSTYRGDDSDIQIPYKSSSTVGNGIAYVNDSIIV